MAKALPVRVVQTGLETSLQEGAKKAGPLVLSATVDPSSFKRLAQPLGRVSGLATEFEKSIAASNARVIAFGASVGIINGVQNAFASLVKTTIEVEKSLTNIAVISGKTVDELQPFSRALFEIAKNTAQSFQTASEAALEFSRQGLGLEETLKRTQDALTLTRFTSLSAAEAVDVLTAAANSFGTTGITTSEILNKLVAVDTKFAVSAEDLAKGLSRAGSIAQEVGVNFDELNAIVTIAQERTARGGAVIGNAFKTIFTRIRSDETIKALQSVGIYSFDAEGRLKPVVGLLEELAGKINTLSETKRIEVLEAIASKYNINVLTALVDDLGSTASKFREARDVSAGAQSEAYQRQIELNQTLDAVITRVTNSAAQLANTLGKIGVTDSLKSLLNFFDNILTGINDVIDSEGIGGTIAKGLISGLSGVFFKIGIPLLLAIFVKLTRDIAQFGVESLKTILGINKEVRERQALEQAVVNTLIKDQQVMATILSLSGDRAKQERYLLSVYNEQLAALQKVQSIAAGVAPALQAAGLSATSGSIKRRAAEGYLPAAEAKDVRRGVGGASPSSKVVEIPNFSFGGGKRGTMVANTSEYIVPNYAGGSGTAIFNQDMAKQYGLPPGAKKITASGGFVPTSGFVPNFAERQPKNIKAMRQGRRFEENLNLKFFGQRSYAYNAVLDFPKPKGFGADSETKNALGMDSKSEYGDAKRTQNKKSEKSLLDKYLRTPEGRQEFLNAREINRNINLNPNGLSMLFLMEGEDAKKFASATTEDSIWSKATRSLFKDKFGESRSVKTITMPYIADKINKDALKSYKAANGYIPNFVELNDKGIYAGLVGETAPDNKPDVQSITKYVTPSEKGLDVKDTGIKSADSVTFDVYRVPKKNEFKLKSIREALGNTGKNLAIDLAREVTGGALGNNVAEQKLTQTFNPGSLQSFANTIFEASVGALLSDKSFQDYTEQSTTSLFDLNIAGNSLIKKNFGIKDSVNALEVKGASTPKLLNSIAEKIYKATAGGQDPFAKRTRVYIEAPGRVNNRKVATAFYKDGVPYVEKEVGVFEPMREGFDASKYELLKNPKTGVIYRGAALGYVPNYVSERAKAAIDRLKKEGATSGEMRAAEAAEARILGRESAIPRSLLTLDDEKFLETQGGSIEKAMGFGLNPILEKLQSIRNNEELQNSDSTQIKSLKEKIGTVNLQRVWKMIGNQEGRRLQVQKTLIEKRYPTRIQGAALGYIPNFADNEPLKEAISREIGAGVSPARVRVTQDGRLKNRDNPNGLAVINTRDEPNGKIPNDFRERGMRAAMASRGFVPNFAEGVSLKGATKFTTETQDIMGGAPISAPFPKEELAKLRKVLNEAVAAYEAEIKAGKDLEEAKKKLNEATNKATSQANLSKESASKVQSAVAKTAGAITPEKKNDSKGIDIGKFLVLQTAIVGATSALQAFTEQNSTAANAIEGVNAGLSGLATFAALATSVNLPLRIFLGSLTALASAAPLLSRFFESQKDPAQKASEALEKLAKQAEKTGQQLTPETLLAAIREQNQVTKVKQETTTVSEEVTKALKTRGVEATDRNIGSLTSFLLATGGVTRQDGKVTGIDQKAFDELLNKSGVVQTEKRQIGTNRIPVGPGASIAIPIEQEARVLSEKDLIGNIENQLEKFGKKTRNRVASVEELSKLDEDQRRRLDEQNAIEDARQRVLESLFNTQLKINADYNKSLIQSNNIVAALERQKGLLTESEYITAKANQEREKANAEFEKARLLVIEDLKKQLGAGEKDSPLGEQAQKFFENLDPKILQNLVDAFEQTGGNVTASNQAYQDFIAAVQESTGATGAFVNGMLQNLNQLGSKGAGAIRDIIRSGSQSQRTARAARDNAVAQSDSAAANELASTELNKLISSISINEMLLNKQSGIIEGTNQAFDGERTFSYAVSVEREKLRKTISDLQVQNALEIGAAEEKIKTDIRLTQLRNEHAAQMRATLGVERAAEIAASNLVEETSKRVFELAAQSKNASLKLKTDTEILDAETNLINAYSLSYNGSVKENDIRAKLSNALAKSTRSEQEKDAELQVQIGLIRTNWQTEKNDIGRKTALLKEQNAKIDLIDESIKLEQQLNLETEELIAARRKASAGLRQVNLEKAVKNEITSAGTTNLNEISTRIKQGEALATEGVQFGFEKQALASVARRRLAGRTNLDLRESTNILSGRDNSIQQNLEIQRGVLLDQAETFQQIIGNQTPKLFADGMAEAMQAALNQADDLGGALRNVALNFLKSLQSAFLQNASRQIIASILPSAVPPAGRKDGGYVKGYATGGLVTGGSGYKDDVPAMLSEGEYVIRKSSVSKYGASNLQKLNSGEAPKFAAGGIFLPGIRGQTEISGYKDLTAFAKQTTTSGATDVLAGGATTAFANLEDQSSRLSAYALTREDDIINQEISSAQEQALNIVKEREAYRTQQRKEFQRQLKSTAISAALSFGLSSVMGAGAKAASAAKAAKAAEAAKNIGSAQQLFNTAPQSFLSGSDYKLPTGALPTFGSTPSSILNTQAPSALSQSNLLMQDVPVSSFQKSTSNPLSLLSRLMDKPSMYLRRAVNITGFKTQAGSMQKLTPGKAYGGMMKRYNAGGPTDDIPALLMGGEYVMNRQATKKYGKQFFDSINQGRAPRFADGGQVSTSEPSFAEKAAAMSDSKADGGTNVSININVTGQSSQMQTEGETKDKWIDYKQMSKQIEQIVLKTIAEQKRAGGMLKSGR